MPSPFPGMDPYLESSAFWRDVHQSLIYCCRAALNAVLPPEYAAELDERLYVVNAARSVYADAASIRRERPTTGEGGVGVAEPLAYDPPRIIRLEREEVRESFIEIVVVHEGGRLVAAIKVLSPANKRNGAGREEYLRKQRDLLASDAHLLEIDLLRGGEHTLTVPPEEVNMEREHYRVCLHRARGDSTFELWSRSVREPLPLVTVPLDAGQGGVPLDLQAVFTRAYDEGLFARRADYRGDPDPPLSAEDASWADALLRERGLREGRPAPP